MSTYRTTVMSGELELTIDHYGDSPALARDHGLMLAHNNGYEYMGTKRVSKDQFRERMAGAFLPASTGWIKATPESIASIPMDEKLSERSFCQRSADLLVIPTVRGERYAPTFNYIYEFHGKREWAVPTHFGHGWGVSHFMFIPNIPEERQ